MSTIGNILCSYCELKFEDDKALKEHFKVEHLVNLTKPPGNAFHCKTDDCQRSFKQSRTFFRYICLYHYFQKPKNDITEPLIKKRKIWNLSSVESDDIIAEMMANLRFSTIVTGADLARVNTAVEHLLNSVFKTVTDKVKDYFDFKSFDLDDYTLTFINQFKYISSPTMFSSITSQIKAIKNKIKYIDPTDVYMGQTIVEKYNKSTEKIET